MLRDLFLQEDEKEEKNAVYLCLLAVTVAVSALSLISTVRARLQIMKAVGEVRRTMPDLRFASQLYIREHASEEERAEYVRSKGKKCLYR